MKSIKTSKDGLVKTLKVDFICHTNGKGYWTDDALPVRITKIILDTHVYDEDDDLDLDLDSPPDTFVEVYFSKKTWSLKKNGFIYTDPLFLKELKMKLKEDMKALGHSVSKLNYTEQGMQGEDYVHLMFGDW